MPLSVFSSVPREEIPSYKCPKCGTSTDYRIPRGIFIKTMLPFVSVKRYWCPKCFNRFYVKVS